MLKTYNDFLLLEFNKSDVDIITSSEISNKFTIAFEIELETDDKNIIPPDIIDENILIQEIRTNLFNVLDNEQINYKDKFDFIDNILNDINFDDDDEILENLLNTDLYDNDIDKLIIYNISNFYQDILDRLDIDISDDEFLDNTVEYLKQLTDNVKLHLPSFYEKYENELEFVLDTTLEKGVEIKQKLYIEGIDKSIEFLNDFFNDFNKQEYWKFSKNTGLHINIGFNSSNVKWNIVKGMMLLKDLKKDEIPYVYKDMLWRMNTKFTNSILNNITIDDDISTYSFNDMENYILSKIKDSFKKHGSKYFGFNIDRLRTNNYVEFRYVGGEVTKDIIIHKMLYFCYIVYIMVNKEFKIKQYHKNFYKFINKKIKQYE